MQHVALCDDLYSPYIGSSTEKQAYRSIGQRERYGDAENARPENDGQRKLRGLENAGLENDGQTFSKL